MVWSLYFCPRPCSHLCCVFSLGRGVQILRNSTSLIKGLLYYIGLLKGTAGLEGAELDRRTNITDFPDVRQRDKLQETLVLHYHIDKARKEMEQVSLAHSTNCIIWLTVPQAGILQARMQRRATLEATLDRRRPPSSRPAQFRHKISKCDRIELAMNRSKLGANKSRPLHHSSYCFTQTRVKPFA